mmetsp:Transcript_30303/g.45065  ORF Transcript_30303/g.45065 Transcript_30303/m.45065 type:complete len:117 (-) Transcript_30303:844-1194(-)
MCGWEAIETTDGEQGRLVGAEPSRRIHEDLYATCPARGVDFDGTGDGDAVCGGVQGLAIGEAALGAGDTARAACKPDRGGGDTTLVTGDADRGTGNDDFIAGEGARGATCAGAEFT